MKRLLCLFSVFLLAIACYLPVFAAGESVYESEPNDSIATANPISATGNNLSGKKNSNSDKYDYYKVYVHAGVSYEIYVSSSGSSTVTVDCFNTSGFSVGIKSDGYNGLTWEDEIDFNAAYTGYYYVRVNTGDYTGTSYVVGVWDTIGLPSHVCSYTIHQHAQEPTCIWQGYDEYLCVCGKTMQKNFVAPTGHIPTTPESCTAPRECTVCGESISMIGHIWNQDYTIDLAPTYEKEGSKSIHCSVCDTIQEGSAVTIPKLEKEENPFTDLEEGFFYVEPVLWAVESGITSGTSATTFSPNDPCTRGQVVTFLWRAAGKPAPSTADTAFTDLQAGWFYEDAVLWAVENGITSGTTTTTFSPDAPCTRAQVVTFLWRAMGCPAPTSTENPFTDLQEGWYYNDAVLWAVENGITTGTSATTFEPDKPCTRAQVVTFLYRTYN